MSFSPKPPGDASTCVWNHLDPRVMDKEQSEQPARFGSIYRPLRVIGRGGMGTVLQVKSGLDGNLYALKCCLAGENLRRRFVREVRFLGNLKHPNIVPILDARLEHQPPFYVMPLATGSLQDEVEILARSLPTSLRVFQDICAGVKAIHDSGVVHRDLKPSNILRLADRSIVVADFGASKRDPRHSSVLTGTSAIVGTLTYLPPEQLLPQGSRQADRRSDLFQLGKILYQLTTGRSPAVMELERLPVGLAHIVRRATATRPDRRYPDVDSLMIALDVFVETTVGHAHPRARLDRFLERMDRVRPIQEPTRAELHENLSLLHQRGSEPESGVFWFDAVPSSLLRSFAREIPGDFVTVLDLYRKRICVRPCTLDFQYADLVATRMRGIFESTTHAGLKTLALRIALVTAVALNRYSAMATVRQLLRQVKTLSLALPVSEMLREHLEEFREVTPGLDPQYLHTAIRAILDELTWIETVTF